ncbi:transporter [Xylophilus sp. GW821-FHT01B05]
MPPVSLPPADPSAPVYGADSAGLICGFRFAPGAPVQEIDSAAAAEWLAARARPAPGGGPVPAGHGDASFVWLHFNLAHAAAERWLQRHADLSDTFYEALRDGLHSTRIERADDALVAVVNDVHFDFSFEPSDLSTLWVSVEQHLVVTARHRPLRAVDQLRLATKGGEALQSSAELLERLLRAQADVLVEIVRGVTQRIDQIEDELLAGRLVFKRAKLGVLRRLLVRLQRLLAPEPAALFRLLQHPPDWLDEEGVQGLRESSEEFSVVLRDMSALQERIKLLQEEIAAGVNEDNNRSLFVLTVVTVLALPINILAGLFGMNVGGIPLAEHPHGFWIVIAIVASFTAVAAWFAFRKK